MRIGYPQLLLYESSRRSARNPRIGAADARNHLQEMSLHARSIGPDAREMLKGPHRLPDHHTATVEGAAATLYGGAQKFGLKREIDDLRHPHCRSQQGLIERQARMSRHSRRSGVDQAVSAPRGRCELIGGRNRPAGVVSSDSARQRFGALVVLVDDEEL